MAGERLSRDEVERIAIEFAQRKWGGEVTIQGVWQSSIDRSMFEVKGKIRRHEQVSTTSGFVDFVDTPVWCPFELQVSAKDKEVTGWKEEPPPPPPKEPPPPPPNFPYFPPEPIVFHEPSVEPKSPTKDFDDRRNSRADRKLKESEAKYWEARAERERRR